MSNPNTPYAHGHSTETVKGHAQRTVYTSAQFIIPYLQPGKSVIDLGCGPGSITKGFAELVKPGKVIGVDQAETAIQAARDGVLPAAEQAGLNLEFQVGDIFKLPFLDESFDVVYAHQVVLHLPFERVESAIREMKRICKVGGIVAFRDGKPDKGGHQIFPWDYHTQKMIDIVMQRTYTTGAVEQQSGHFWGIANTVGFTSVERIFTQDVFDDEEKREVWGGQWAKRSSEESFRQFALDHKLATRDELDEMPKAWRAWVEKEGAWASMFTIEHICTK